MAFWRSKTDSRNNPLTNPTAPGYDPRNDPRYVWDERWSDDGKAQMLSVVSHANAADEARRAEGAKKFRLAAIGAVAAPLAGAGIAALGGGTATASAYPGAGLFGAPAAAAGSTAGAGSTGMGFSLGKLLGSRGFETIANGVTGLFGMHAQNKANKYATDANSRLTAQQLAMEQARIKAEQDANALDRTDAERRWLAEQERAKQEFDYTKALTDRQLALEDAREARRAVYRPYSEAAMRSLGSILRIR